MEIKFERHFDAALKALYDEGQDINYGGETLTFSRDGRALIYDIDDLTPSYALLRKELIAGVSQQARISPVLSGSGAFQVSKEDQLVVQSLRFLSMERSVQYLRLYNGPTGAYKQVSVADFL
jgi:hypothetical protein